MFGSVDYRTHSSWLKQLIAGDTLKSQTSKSKKVEKELCVEVHSESDRTGRSVDRNQVPRHKSDF